MLSPLYDELTIAFNVLAMVRQTADDNAFKRLHQTATRLLFKAHADQSLAPDALALRHRARELFACCVVERFLGRKRIASRKAWTPLTERETHALTLFVRHADKRPLTGLLELLGDVGTGYLRSGCVVPVQVRSVTAEGFACTYRHGELFVPVNLLPAIITHTKITPAVLADLRKTFVGRTILAVISGRQNEAGVRLATARGSLFVAQCIDALLYPGVLDAAFGTKDVVSLNSSTMATVLLPNRAYNDLTLGHHTREIISLLGIGRLLFLAKCPKCDDPVDWYANALAQTVLTKGQVIQADQSGVAVALAATPLPAQADTFTRLLRKLTASPTLPVHVFVSPVSARPYPSADLASHKSRVLGG